METKPLTAYHLHDSVELYPGLLSQRWLCVFASSRHAADVTARIHHSVILHKLGVL